MQNRRRTRLPLPFRLAALLAVASACESAGPLTSSEPVDVAADALRSRHARVAIGQTQAEVAAAMGSLPVRRPGHPEAPFPTPLHVAEWTAPSGDEVRLEVYVIATRPADGCPDVAYDDAPVAFAGGRVVATTWEQVEWRWREWGGELAGLRALQNRVAECEPPEPPVSRRRLDTPGTPSYIPAPSPAPLFAGPSHSKDPAVALEFLCRKIGMTQLFTDTGEAVPVTVLEAGPNRVIQVKTEATDGYSAIQLGYGERRPSRTPKPERGHFEKAGAAPQRMLRESRLPADEVAKYAPGQEIKCDVFSPGQRVDVIGTSKGRGTAGVVKRHHFTISNQSHGTHEDFRHAGSIGPGSFPGRVIKGLRMAGRMGNERVTTQNIEVVRVDAERGLLYVRGGVPGHPNAFVRVRSSVKA